MFVYALICFALAAVGGLTMVVLRIRSESNPPLALALGHGALAATGLVITIYGSVMAGFSAVTGGAVGFLLLAAIGGFALITMHLRGQTIPLAVVFGHAGLAVLGVVAVLLAAVGM